MKSKVKEIIIPGCVLFAICIVTSVLLAITNGVTAPKIAERQEQTAIETRLEVLPNAKGGFDEAKVTFDGTEYTYHTGKNEKGEVIGYVFTTNTKGYGGNVSIMTGINTDGTVAAIETLELNETAGLGMKAAEDDFKNMYKGKSDQVTVIKNVEPSGNQIKAITGATITSEAVTDAVNIALNLYSEITGGAK